MTKDEAERTAAYKREKAEKTGRGMRVFIGSMMFGSQEEFYVRTEGYDTRSWSGSITYWQPPPYAKDKGDST